MKRSLLLVVVCLFSANTFAQTRRATRQWFLPSLLQKLTRKHYQFRVICTATVPLTSSGAAWSVTCRGHLPSSSRKSTTF